MAKDMILNVVTPEKPILSGASVEEIVLPGEMGQLNIRPGHVNFMTSMKHGIFAYRIGDNWTMAFLSGGFAEVSGDQVMILAETMEMANELNLAKAEADVQDIKEQLKTFKPGSSEHFQTQTALSIALSKVQAAKNKLR